jgi:hypothetical protein
MGLPLSGEGTNRRPGYFGHNRPPAPTRWAAARMAKMTTASDANHNELSDHATTFETVEHRKRIEHQDRAFVVQLRAAIMCGRETPAGVLGYEDSQRVARVIPGGPLLKCRSDNPARCHKARAAISCDLPLGPQPPRPLPSGAAPAGGTAKNPSRRGVSCVSAGLAIAGPALLF